MAKPFRIVLCLSSLVILSGCYQLPKQSGTWKGEITARTLYASNGDSYQCAAFLIREGPVLKAGIPTEAILVKQDMTFYGVGEFRFTNAIVSGQIGQDFPKSPDTGRTVSPVRGEPLDLSGVLRVKRAEPGGSSQ
jgi:hypothetical protein